MNGVSKEQTKNPSAAAGEKGGISFGYFVYSLIPSRAIRMETTRFVQHVVIEADRRIRD